jgi:chromate transporter
MVLIELLWSFIKIGFTSFGGLSMIPLISSEMLSHHWMSTSEVSDIVAIAEMTPGPLGLNCATFAGIKTAGIPGAVAAILGILSPTLTVCVCAAIFFEKFKKSHRMIQLMTGIRPACLGMIAGVIVSLSLTNYADQGSVNLPAVGIGLLDLVLLLKWKVSVPKVICLNAALGLLCFGVLS